MSELPRDAMSPQHLAALTESTVAIADYRGSPEPTVSGLADFVLKSLDVVLGHRGVSV
jgi:hypothetical protein